MAAAAEGGAAVNLPALVLAQQQQPQPPADADAIKAAWTRLWDAPADNRAHSLAWRLMHGRLPCDLYRATHGCRGVQPTCTWPACASSQPAASLEHVFVHCPAYAAARAWLAATWHAVAGHLPPLTAAVLLGDCSDAWPHYPSAPAQAELWNALRQTWLLALWEAHSQPAWSQRSPHAVVAATVRELQHLIRAHFCFCSPEDHVFPELPGRILTRAIKVSTPEEFNGRWGLNGVLCQAVPRADGTLALDVRLSMQHPVPAPVEQPQPPPNVAADAAAA